MSIERNKNLLVIPVNGSPESKLKDYKNFFIVREPVAKVVMVEGGVGESLIVRNIWVQGLELYTCKVSVFYFENCSKLGQRAAPPTEQCKASSKAPLARPLEPPRPTPTMPRPN